MKETKTRKTEKTIINLYYCSQKKEADFESIKAGRTIKYIVECFQLISIFTNENHIKILEQLYLSKNNIRTLGVRRMSEKVFLHENTLYVYRQKYCLLIDMIFMKMKNHET